MLQSVADLNSGGMASEHCSCTTPRGLPSMSQVSGNPVVDSTGGIICIMAWEDATTLAF